jgi:hypothetical protein
MQINVEVWKNKEAGFIHLSEFGSPDSKYNSEHKYSLLGTTMIDIKEPKKKKLVYQWLFRKLNDSSWNITSYYKATEKEVRETFSYQDVEFIRINESEKEIEV